MHPTVSLETYPSQEQEQNMIEPIGIGRPVAVSVEEAAALLGIGRTLAYQLVLTHELRSIKVGRRRLVIRASIEEYVARLEEACPSAVP